MKLSQQIALLIVTATIAIGVLTTMWSSHLTREALETRLSEESAFIAATLSEALVTRVINGEVTPVLETIRKTTRENNHVSYIFIIGFDGRLFAHSFAEGFPRALATWLTPNATLNSKTHYRTANGTILHIANPMIKGMDAQLHIGMNDDRMQQRITELNRQMASIALAIILAATLAGLMLGHRLTRPLAVLSQHMAAYGQGKHPKLSTTPQRYSDPHLANLNRAFRDMMIDRENAEALTDRLGRILDTSLNEIYVFSVDTLRFIHANASARQNLGYTLEELRQLTPLDIKPDYTLESFQTLIEPLRNGQVEQLYFETRHQRKDNSDYPVRVNLQISRQKPQAVFFALILDVTEQQQVAEELRRHRDHLEDLVEARTRHIRRQAQIIEQIHDAVIATDMNDNITLWNRGAERLFGYDSQQAMGEDLLMLYPQDQRQDKQLASTLLTQPNEHNIELQLQKASGECFHAHLSLSLLTDEARQPTGILAYAIDINDRKLAEQALRQRTDELAAVNKELETFSYSVSHDLRAPLRAIDGFSLALLEDYTDHLDQTGLDYLQRVRRAAQHMGTLIDDLLQLSRITRSALEARETDLSRVALNIINRLRDNDPHSHTTVTIAPDITARADERLMHIALENLLGNAWKFSRKRDDAHIELGQLQENGEDIYFVRDNGAGFNMTFADKLFSPFQRLHSTQEFEGTGIGLATVMRIINRHGGRVWAHGEEGTGATFYFTLGNPGQGQLSGTDHPAPKEGNNHAQRKDYSAG